LTMPETADWAPKPADVHRARTRTNARVVRMTANLSSDQAGNRVRTAVRLLA